ncbi:MAG: Bromodomain-containing protein 2, partial [Paramarteilia canceri]
KTSISSSQSRESSILQEQDVESSHSDSSKSPQNQNRTSRSSEQSKKRQIELPTPVREAQINPPKRSKQQSPNLKINISSQSTGSTAQNDPVSKLVFGDSTVTNMKEIKTKITNEAFEMKSNFFDPHVHTASQENSLANHTKMIAECFELLNKLKSHSDVVYPFLKHPPNFKFPDLHFVEKALKLGHYRCVEDFATAVRHVFMHIVTTCESSSKSVELATSAMEIFHEIYFTYLSSKHTLLCNKMSLDNKEKLNQVYQLLMKDCEARKDLITGERKYAQLEKRVAEVEKQFTAYKFQTTQTIDKLRKRISYLKSKQQSDLVYINEKFQSAVKNVAATTGNFSSVINGQSQPNSPLSNPLMMNKHFKAKLQNYSKARTIAPIKEMDTLEQTSRDIMLAGVSKSDDEEESYRVLTSEEKRKLSHDINRLSQKMLGELTTIISECEDVTTINEGEDKNGTEEGNSVGSQQLVLDYDKMKPSTLRTVLRFVQSCVKRLPRPKQIQNIPVTGFSQDYLNSKYNSESIRLGGDQTKDCRNESLDDNSAKNSQQSEKVNINDSLEVGAQQGTNINNFSNIINQSVLNGELISTKSEKSPNYAPELNSHAVSSSTPTLKQSLWHLKNKAGNANSRSNNQLTAAVQSLLPKGEEPEKLHKNGNPKYTNIFTSLVSNPSPDATEDKNLPLVKNSAAWGSSFVNELNKHASAVTSQIPISKQSASLTKSPLEVDSNQASKENRDLSPVSNSGSESAPKIDVLKIEAQKRRAASINKNETIEQREMMANFEQIASSNDLEVPIEVAEQQCTEAADASENVSAVKHPKVDPPTE